MGSNSEIQGYNVYSMLHFHRKFSSNVTVVRLDRNQRQSRAEERILGRNTVRPGGNAQPRRGYRGGSYGGRGEQIMWRARNNSEAYRGPSGPSQNQTGSRRDPNAMDVDKEGGGDRTCYVCGK